MQVGDLVDLAYRLNGPVIRMCLLTKPNVQLFGVPGWLKPRHTRAMPPAPVVDLRAYDIDVTQHAEGGSLMATVRQLPGCIAVGPTAAALESAIEQAIVLWLEDHPDAPAHFKTRARRERPTLDR